jgi:hypothetical protein
MKYKLHYMDKLRSIKLGSPLFFGKAIDEAIMALLLSKKKSLTVEEKLLSKADPNDLFIKAFTITEHFGEPLNLQFTELTEYYKSDIDVDLLTDEDVAQISDCAKVSKIELNTIQEVEQFVEEAQGIIKNKTSLDKDEQIVYNNIAWHALKRKGLLLIQAFKEQIFPSIAEVFSIQEKVTLPDENDEFIGFIDFVASFTDSLGEKFVVDLKTSSKVYPEDSVRTSDQLSCYSEYKDIRQCAYIVLVKALKKREPRVKTQIVKDTIPEEQIQKTFDKISGVFYSINDGIFEKCYEKGDESKCFAFGRKCPYYMYCRNGDLKDLKYAGERK